MTKTSIPRLTSRRTIDRTLNRICGSACEVRAEADRFRDAIEWRRNPDGGNIAIIDTKRLKNTVAKIARALAKVEAAIAELEEGRS
jgi:hypothetical protein